MMPKVWWVNTLAAPLLLVSSGLHLDAVASGTRQTEISATTAIEKFRDSLKPQLSYRLDVDVCDDLKLVNEVSSRLLKGQTIEHIALEMARTKSGGSGGVVGDFGLKLMKAGEMSDKLSMDKTLMHAVYQQCGQQTFK